MELKAMSPLTAEIFHLFTKKKKNSIYFGRYSLM